MSDEQTNGFEDGQLIGMTVDEASEFIKPYGYIIRVIRKNGSPVITIRDFRTDRLNVKIVDNKITEVSSVG